MTIADTGVSHQTTEVFAGLKIAIAKSAPLGACDAYKTVEVDQVGEKRYYKIDSNCGWVSCERVLGYFVIKLLLKQLWNISDDLGDNISDMLDE